MAILAALSLDLPDDQRQKNISAAKVQVGRSGRRIGQEAVQMHGAIGITSEYKVGHAFKRLTAIDALLGDADNSVSIALEFRRSAFGESIRRFLVILGQHGDRFISDRQFEHLIELRLHLLVDRRL